MPVVLCLSVEASKVIRMVKKKRIGTYVELYHLPAGLFAGDVGRGKFADDVLDWNKIFGTFEEWKQAISDTISWAWNEITKTATDILDTIGDWATIVAQFGNLAWNQITKTTSDIINTIGSWTNMITQLGNLAWNQITKTTADIANYLAGIQSDGLLDLANVGLSLLSPAKVLIEGAITLANWIFSGGKIKTDQLSKSTVETTYLGFSDVGEGSGNQDISSDGSYTKIIDLGTVGYERLIYGHDAVWVQSGDENQDTYVYYTLKNVTDTLILSRSATPITSFLSFYQAIAATLIGIIPANKQGKWELFIKNKGADSQVYYWAYNIYQIPAHLHDIW